MVYVVILYFSLEFMWTYAQVQQLQMCNFKKPLPYFPQINILCLISS